MKKKAKKKTAGFETHYTPSDFNAYVENQLEALLPLSIPLNIYHEPSHENSGLQAVDLFCWGIFRKYEMGETEWYNVYKNMMATETEYLR